MSLETKLVVGRDDQVAEWIFKELKIKPMQFNAAVGVTKDDKIVGGILFTAWNGSDVEIHFFGPGVLTRRIVKAIMGMAVLHFNVNRMTVRTRKPHMARGVSKLGAVYEGKIRRLYGPTDNDEHAGEQYAFFRETMERLSGLKGKSDVRRI